MTRAADIFGHAAGLCIVAIAAALFVYAFTAIEGDPPPVALPWVQR